MNRPKIENYLSCNQYPITYEGFDIYHYKQDLEKYCDKLENTLDKAYKELELINKQLIELDRSFLSMTKEQWKEYLLEESEKQ